jgi:uncharacterized protein YbjT (DUF2867 family)
VSSNGNGAGPHNGVPARVNGTSPPSADPHWWVGFFAATIAEALKEPREAARFRLRETLKRFNESALCTDELRDTIGAKRRPITAPLNDSYDMAADWKPCGNPECRMPIPRRSPKLYCDQLCRHIAEEYAAGDTEEEDDIPF